MSDYYRLIVDFSWEDGEDFESLINRLSDAIIEVIDPEHEEGTPCARAWDMRGGSVTHEYALYEQVVENAVVGKFKEALSGDVSVEDFLGAGEMPESDAG